jgi:thiol-disulfide isomerase/thioredoxin
LPHLDALNSKYANRGVRVVVVDVIGSKALTGKMIANAGYNGSPVLLDEKELAHKEYGITATPTTFVVDPAGRMIFKHLGYGPGMEIMFDKEVDLLLARTTT